MDTTLLVIDNLNGKTRVDFSVVMTLVHELRNQLFLVDPLGKLYPFYTKKECGSYFSSYRILFYDITHVR